MIQITQEEVEKIKDEINIEQPYNKKIIEDANYYFHKLDRTALEGCLLFNNCFKIMSLSSLDKIQNEIKKFYFLKELNKWLQKYHTSILGKGDALYWINDIYMMNTDLIEDFITLTQNILGIYNIKDKNEESDFETEENELRKS